MTNIIPNDIMSIGHLISLQDTSYPLMDRCVFFYITKRKGEVSYAVVNIVYLMWILDIPKREGEKI